MENKSINQIKLIAAIFVVFIHTSAFRYVNKTGYIFDFIVDTISRFGVPVFFSISGYFLYIKFKKDSTKYYLNYVKKILWLHLWVGAVYLTVGFTDMTIRGIPVPPSFYSSEHLFNNFLYGGLHFHLWYLPSLVFAVTILFISTKIKKEKELFYLGIFLNIIGTFGNSEIYASLGHISFPSRNGLYFGLPYVMLGYYLAQNKIAEKLNITKIKLFKIIAFLFVLQIIERSAAVLTLKSSQGSNYFLSTMPLVFFIMILGIRENNLFPKLNKYSHKSLNIYLWHPLAMIIFHRILLRFTNEKQILFSLLYTPLIIASILFFPKITKRG